MSRHYETPKARRRPRPSTLLFNARRVRVQHTRAPRPRGYSDDADLRRAHRAHPRGRWWADMLLIGDSLGNAILGHSSTLRLVSRQ